MTQEQRIYYYYRTGVECLNRGRRADAALMAAAIRCFDPTHRLAIALRAALAGTQHEHDDADDDTIGSGTDARAVSFAGNNPTRRVTRRSNTDHAAVTQRD